nr:butyrate--CoA ligase AAE11, peroxisomal-like [Ipomoea batatas]
MDRLPKCGANYVPLTPLTFLLRASKCYADRPKSVVYGGVSFTWRQTYDRCCRLASSLRALNVVKNDVVSVLAPNVPAMYEMHFAVPMAGAVLNTINTRLDAKNIATILRHSERRCSSWTMNMWRRLGRRWSCLMAENTTQIPLVVVIDDVDSPTGIRLGELEYEQLVLQGNPNMGGVFEHFELDFGVGNGDRPGLPLVTAYVPLQRVDFHLGGRGPRWDQQAKPTERRALANPVQILTGGAPPPPALLGKIEQLGFHVVHAYGLTEATGPALVCEWQGKWNLLPKEDQANLKARQGLSILTLADAEVVTDLKTMQRVPRDGKTMGEIVLRGSSIMKGYYKNAKANFRVLR